MQEISSKQLNDWINSKKALIVIDVRQPYETDQGIIPKANLIPLADIDSLDFSDQPIPTVIYCQAGVRSEKACQILLKKFPDLNCFNLIGGIASWQCEGYQLQIPTAL